MLATLLIFSFAVMLLLYWFRYACTQALSAKKRTDCVARVAAVNSLSFLVVEAKLKTGETELDRLSESLDRDYRVLNGLLRHGRGLRLPSIEQRMIFWDYHILRIWYACVRKFSAAQARKALEERSRILAYLAHHMGQRSASQAVA